VAGEHTEDIELTAYQVKVREAIRGLINSGFIREAEQAIAEYEQMILDDAEMYSIKAVAAMLDGRLDDAEEIINKGLAYNDKNFDLLYNLGYIHREKDNIRQAIGQYELAYLFAPSNEVRQQIKQDIALLRKNIVNYSEKAHVPLVSIVVLAYNQLDYTKLCVESIFRHTMGIDYELITVNNGSSDETQEYFDSLPNARVVTLPENVGPVNGFNAGLKIAVGKYTAGVCNDFIFTANWMDNLLKCIESDNRIGFVSPGSSNISNGQQINGSYSNIAEMQEFAKNYNISDSAKWEERVRLLPNVLMVRTELFRKLGYYDPRFYFGEFADDDFAFRIRREGYKLIFMRDTFVYHFGSISTGENQRKSNSLEVSRKIFSNKHGIDAWEEASYDNVLVQAATRQPKTKPRILGINTACGATPLQIKNKLKKDHMETICIWNITNEGRFLQDLMTVSTGAALTNVNNFRYSWSGEKFDIIVFERDFERAQPIKETMESLKSLLAEGGQLFIKVQNPTYFLRIGCLLNGLELSQNNVINSFIDKDKFINQVQEIGFNHIEVISCKANITQKDHLMLEELVNLKLVTNKMAVKDLLEVAYFIYCIR